MSKTKEHIFDEIVGEHHRTLSPANYSNVVKAMDEHAKNQAIDFAEWISRLGLFQGIILEWYDRYDKKVAETTVELYALFLQSQSQ